MPRTLQISNYLSNNNDNTIFITNQQIDNALLQQ